LSNEITNEPEIRFVGYEGDWERRKFTDYFNFPVSTNSLSRAMLNYNNGEIKNIHYGDILIKYSTILNVKEDEIPYITGGELEKYKSNLLENQDLIFADAAEDESVGKAVEVSGITNENLVSGLHTIVARAKGEKDSFFWGYYINSDIYHRQLLRLMQGSKVSAISKGNLQKTNVSFPNRMKEQQKVGAFFKKLDDTIALHQHELDLLEQIKQTYLQKMFPKTGEDKPEIRFAGFTDAWEQRKLSEIINLIGGNAFSSSSATEEGIPWLKIANVGKNGINWNVQTFLPLEYWEIHSDYQLLPGDYVMALTRPILNHTLKIGMVDKQALLNQRVAKLFFIINKEFTFQLLQRRSIVDKIENELAGTDPPNLGSKNLTNIDVMITNNKYEAKRIGNFFCKFDNTITLHQRKLDSLKEMKKTLLQKMFV